jgi:uncharacterized RmlC-like cupin family protein
MYNPSKQLLCLEQIMSEKPTCKVIHSEKTYDGLQGFTYFEGVSAQNVGSSAICMHLLTIPPGGRAKAHLHEKHETTIYVIKGEAEMWYGENLSEHVITKAGDFVYIPAGVPHLPANRSDSEVIAVIARTDPNEQESIVLLPELEQFVAL